MVDARAVEQWECNACHEVHDDADDATDCCANITELEDKWECDECLENYDSEEEADECCEEEDEEEDNEESESIPSTIHKSSMLISGTGLPPSIGSIALAEGIKGPSEEEPLFKVF